MDTQSLVLSSQKTTANLYFIIRINMGLLNLLTCSEFGQAFKCDPAMQPIDINMLHSYSHADHVPDRIANTIQP